MALSRSTITSRHEGARVLGNIHLDGISRYSVNQASKQCSPVLVEDFYTFRMTAINLSGSPRLVVFDVPLCVSSPD